MSSNRKLAIVGAGVSGLAAAWALRDSDWRCVVFEKSRGFSGRAASRTRNGVRFDYGANYFKTDSPELEQLVHRELPTEGLIDIAGEVYRQAFGLDSMAPAQIGWGATMWYPMRDLNSFRMSGDGIRHWLQRPKRSSMPYWRLRDPGPSLQVWATTTVRYLDRLRPQRGSARTGRSVPD